MTEAVTMPRRASYFLHVASMSPHRRTPFGPDQLRQVRQLDTVLDRLERDPHFRHFTLSGSAIFLEDYLTLRPEHFERVERAVGAGRLLVGPWYYAPDPTEASLEALIRNLMIGLRTASVFGAPMRVGYFPAIFSLPDYVPQILKSFGIEVAIRQFTQGAPLETRWQGDDGSEILLCGGDLFLSSALPDFTIGQYRAEIVPTCRSGHLLIVARGKGLERLTEARAELPRDELFHSSPATYADAVQAYARQGELPILTSACTSLAADGGYPRPADRMLSQIVEPLFAWNEYHKPLLPRPQAVIRKLWQTVLERSRIVFDHDLDFEQAYPEDMVRRRQAIQAVTAFAGGHTEPQFGRVVRSSEPAFEITAAKLAEDREGIIVRGRNTTDAPVQVTLTPFRAFAACEITTLDETPTGGRLGVEADGAIRFRAHPHRLLTFWLHD